MKFNGLACYLLWGGLVLLPDIPSAQEVQAIHIEAERERISAERIFHENAYVQTERLCYARFAVSDCLRQARKDRRAALDPLRRQELVLNEMERQSKALAAMNRIQEKVSSQPSTSQDVNPAQAEPASAP